MLNRPDARPTYHRLEWQARSLRALVLQTGDPFDAVPDPAGAEDFFGMCVDAHGALLGQVADKAATEALAALAFAEGGYSPPSS